jgi:hypothetical protein
MEARSHQIEWNDFMKRAEENSAIFWNITLCSPFKSTNFSEEHIVSIFRVDELVEQETRVKSDGTPLCLPYAFTLVSWSAYSSTSKMEVIYSSETSVHFQRT